MADEELKVRITGDATDLKNSLDGAGKQVSGFSDKIGGIGKAATIGGAAVTAAFTKSFLDFTAYETKLVDMAKVTKEPFDQIEAKLGTLDPILGNSKQLMEGYYQVISAGVKDPVEALSTLTIAAETANAAHVDQAEVVKGITKMMAGYEGAISSASEAADLLFSIEKEGQTSVAELIPVIGGLAKSSSDLNVSQNEMAASLATISKTAGSTAEAATQYEAVLTGLLKPTTKMKDMMKDMGYESGEAAIKEKGLVEILKELEERTGGSSQALGELFGRKEALLGFSALSAESFKTLSATIEEVEKGTGGAKQAFEDWTESGAASISEIKNTFLNFSSEVGAQLAPMIKELLGQITEVVKKITEWAKENPKLFESIVKVAAIIGAVAAVGGPILMAVAAFGGVATAITAIISPVGLVVAAVIGLGVAWKTNFLGIRDMTKGVIDFVKGFIERLIDFINRVSEAIKGIVDKVKSFVKDLSGGIKLGPDTAEGFGIGGTSTGQAVANLPFHATGIKNVPRKAFYGLDPGERVLTAQENKSYDQSKSYSPTVNITVQGNGNAEEIKKVVEQALEESRRQYSRGGYQMAY